MLWYWADANVCDTQARDLVTRREATYCEGMAGSRITDTNIINTTMIQGTSSAIGNDLLTNIYIKSLLDTDHRQ